jgi:predicted esterase
MKRLMILWFFCLINYSAVRSDFNEDAVKLIFSDSFLSSNEIYNHLKMFDDYADDDQKGKILSSEMEDGSPWYYYIPGSYLPRLRHGLIIWLHGGVGREDFFPPDDYLYEHPLIDFAEENKLFLLMPMARADCMWWDNAGEQHIMEQLHILKQKYNIDDDRVFLTGFSDGGSGSFHFSYRLPDNFAAFYPLSGMINVSPGANGKPAYIANLKNRYLRAINTDMDALYPASTARLTMALALEAGANLNYLEYWGIGHNWDYFDKDLPLMIGDINKRSRDSFQSQLYWECSSAEEYNRCDWLEITALDSLRPQKDWQIEYNVKLSDTRISIGFYHNAEFKGDGVLVDRIVPESLAEVMQLRSGDVIISMDDSPVTNIDELSRAKDKKKRGDEVELAIYREGKTLKLKGNFPPIEYYDAFFYDRHSSAIKGKFYGNIFEIETSQVAKFALYINPEMVNLAIPIKVIVNGEKIFEDIIDYDLQFMEKNLLNNFDRKAIWINKLEFEVQ